MLVTAALVCGQDPILRQKRFVVKWGGGGGGGGAGGLPSAIGQDVPSSAAPIPVVGIIRKPVGYAVPVEVPYAAPPMVPYSPPAAAAPYGPPYTG